MSLADASPLLGEFRSTGSMTHARSLHTATALADGRVLIAGGFDTTMASLDSAEVYDPITGLFSVTGSMGSERVAAEATLLRNGKVLMVGGQDSSGEAIASVELYDPLTGTFSPTGSLLTPRLNPTVTLLKNGRVLVAGGYEGTSHGMPLASAEIYRPKSGQFVETGSMDTARRNATATRLRNGEVLIVGGYNGEAVNAPELFDPAKGEFRPASPMSSPRRYPSANLLPNGTVLIAGGFATATGDPLTTSERFKTDASTKPNQSGRFIESGTMQTARGRHTATKVTSNTLLIAGGYDGVKPLASAEIYDIARQTFNEIESMQTARFRHTATPLADGRVLIAGGEDSSGALATAELFQIPTTLSSLCA